MQPAGMLFDKTLLSSALVGRDGELSSLEAAIESTGQGKAQSMLVAREAGVGKSRLAEGKLVEHWGVSDSLTMLTQLRVILGCQ